jgi:hypothetical protein
MKLTAITEIIQRKVKGVKPENSPIQDEPEGGT